MAQPRKTLWTKEFSPWNAITDYSDTSDNSRASSFPAALRATVPEA